MGCTTKGTTPTPMRNFLSQMTSFTASKVVIYSASIVELAMQDCFTFLQLTVASPTVNTKPEVYLLE